MNDAPRIRSIAQGPVPERHADRVVAQMIRFLIAERMRVTPKILEILKTSPDASPKHQVRLVERICAAAGSSVRHINLKPGKRGRFLIEIYDWTGWNPATDTAIEAPEQEIPGDPWLAIWLLELQGLGNHRYDQRSNPVLLVKPHALSRGAQRCGLRTIDDLFTLMTLAWNAMAKLVVGKETAAFEAPPAGWRVPFGGGTAVLRRHPRLERTLVLATVWNGNGETQPLTELGGTT
jgi:hypothetical protein